MKKPLKSKSPRREIKIEGVIQLDPDTCYNDFYEQFIDWIEDSGWYFGGFSEEITPKAVKPESPKPKRK